jgi:hypothetical protein
MGLMGELILSALMLKGDEMKDGWISGGNSRWVGGRMGGSVEEAVDG